MFAGWYIGSAGWSLWWPWQAWCFCWANHKKSCQLSWWGTWGSERQAWRESAGQWCWSWHICDTVQMGHGQISNKTEFEEFVWHYFKASQSDWVWSQIQSEFYQIGERGHYYGWFIALSLQASAYNNLKSSLQNFEKKQTGSLVTRNVADLVKKEHFVLDSEYLVTMLVVVPLSNITDWNMKYEKLTDMIVPRSSQLIYQVW